MRKIFIAICFLTVAGWVLFECFDAQFVNTRYAAVIPVIQQFAESEQGKKIEPNEISSLCQQWIRSFMEHYSRQDVLRNAIRGTFCAVIILAFLGIRQTDKKEKFNSRTTPSSVRR